MPVVLYDGFHYYPENKNKKEGNMLKITIGCDPELFVTKKGAFRSAWGLIPGTKEKPHVVKDGAVQVDGCALEFNTDPVDNENDFVTKINSVMGQMKEMVPEYDFAIVPSCRFNGNHFRALPDEAKELGCTPDFNAYTLKENPKPDNKTTMRTASGHVHIGFCDNADPGDPDHMIRCATLVKQLDGYLGLPSVLYDSDVKRRKMYGAAGAFRAKPYGVEYRVLSNAWLLSEDRMRFVFRMTKRAVDDLIAGERFSEKVPEKVLIQAINASNAYTARVRLTNVFGREMVDEIDRLAGREPVEKEAPFAMKAKMAKKAYRDLNFADVEARVLAAEAQAQQF